MAVVIDKLLGQPLMHDHGVSGATPALDNLASVAINTSLISDTDSMDDLGSSSKYWANLYVDDIVMGDTATISTTLNGNLSLVPNGTGYTIIGNAGTTSHTLNTNDDLVVSGRLEVNGIAYFDGQIIQTMSGGDLISLTINASSSSQNSSPTFLLQLPSTGGQNAFQLKIGTDTFGFANFGFNVGGAGKPGFNLGPGGATSRDVNIYRDSANVLKTDDAFYATGNITTEGVVNIDGVQVISNRVIDARCDDAINSGDATTDGVIDALRDAMIAHGLIAAA